MAVDGGRAFPGESRGVRAGAPVHIVLEKATPGTFVTSAGAFLCIGRVELAFDPRPRNHEVVV